MEPILLSIFDLFKIGPGPSSSHTIGPMRAALHFVDLLRKLPDDELKKASHMRIHLFGSLSATGKGHGTETALMAGLLGMTPANCDAEEVLHLFDDNRKHTIKIRDNFTLPFDNRCITYDEVHHSFPYSNTMIFHLKSKDAVLLEKEYYSCGGGFMKCKDDPPPDRGNPLYCYSNMSELKQIIQKENISLVNLLLENEKAIMKTSKEDVYFKLEEILDVMEKAVERGLQEKGVLPGPIGLERKAHTLYEIAVSNVLDVPDNFLVLLDACALAAAEENAAGKKAVTSPTSGSCGVIPAIIYVLKHHFHIDKKHILDGLLAAAAIGFLAKHNASISGAEVGCQGEIGVSCAMGAALVAQVDGANIDIIEIAAEIALEHQLGLTCDPIGGYVQIPCIERNAVGAVEAYNAFILASAGDPKKQKISFDQVLHVMYETGKDMCSKYKETSKGGLAKCDVYC